MIAPSHCGYSVMGKNVAENKKSGNWTNATRSKSCQVRMNVHAASPRQLNVRLVKMAAGEESQTQAPLVSPSAVMQMMNDAEYKVERVSAHSPSPSAMSV